MWLCVNGWNEKERDERKTLCVCGLGWERERERDEINKRRDTPSVSFFLSCLKSQTF